MIRYVLAVALVVAVLGLSATALDHGATLRGESEAASAVERIGTAAVDLHENEVLAPAGGPAPQRVIEVTLPGEGVTSASPARLTVERTAGENLTRVSYRFAGRAERSHVIDAPIVRDTGSTGAADGALEGSFRLGGYNGDTTLRLRLVAGPEGLPVVALTLAR